MSILDTRSIPNMLRQRNTFEAMMLKQFPSSMLPMTALISIAPEVKLSEVDKTWGFDNYIEPNCVSTTALTAGTPSGLSTFTVANGMFVSVGALLYNQVTMEQMRVVSVKGNEVTVRRSVNPKASPAGTMFIVGGSAYEEGSMRPIGARGDSAFASISKAYNHVQIQRTPYSVTGTAEAISLNNQEGIKNILAQERAHAAWRHLHKLERQYLIGEFAPEMLENGEPLRLSSGFFDQMNRYAPQNVMTAPSIMDFDTLEDMLLIPQTVSTDPSGSNKKILMTSQRVLTMLNRLGKQVQNIQYPPTVTAIGQQYEKIVIGSTTYHFKHSALFDTIPSLQGTIAVIDEGAIKRGVLRPTRDAVWSREDSMGIDGYGGDYLTESMLMVTSPTANAVIRGICDIGCKLCVPVSVTKGSITVSHPCAVGEVKVGTVVTVTITAPAGTVKVQTPTGIISVVVPTEGVATFTYTVTANGVQEFAIIPDPTQTIVFSPARASVCPIKSCEDEPLACSEVCEEVTP